MCDHPGFGVLTDELELKRFDLPPAAGQLLHDELQRRRVVFERPCGEDIRTVRVFVGSRLGYGQAGLLIMQRLKPRSVLERRGDLGNKALQGTDILLTQTE